MQLVRALTMISAVLALAACGSSTREADPFATYQLCFDEHHTTESLPVHDAIVVCCLDHPIAGAKPACGADAAACMTYLAANLSPTSATSTEVMTACTDYQTQKGL